VAACGQKLIEGQATWLAALCRQCGIEPAILAPLALLAHEAGSCWLREHEEQFGCRFDTDRLRVDGHRVHRMQSRRGIVLATLDFTGELEVMDAKSFLSDVLLKGIGPAKAFGCGLMLVRRA
jgi:CRISPR system Cascade subunit CasE